MHKRIVVLSKIILAIAALNLFAFAVRHVSQGGTRLGPLTEPIRQFIEFPVTVKNVLEDIKAPPPYHVPVEADFQPINLLQRDLFALNAHAEKGRYVYTLKNLRNDSTHLSWVFDEEEFVGPARLFPVAHPLNPILLPDSSLIGMLYGTNLFRLTAGGEILWKNTAYEIHHSLNLAPDGNFWTCAWGYGFTEHEEAGLKTGFKDDLILKIEVETGKVLFQKSIAEILIENGYPNLLHGNSSDKGTLGEEPFHLNDVQPVLEDGPYWKKGDLFLSLRNISTIVLYRPSTGKILRLIFGPLLAQHDVDILSDTLISIFNNNRVPEFFSSDSLSKKLPKQPTLQLKSSHVAIYNFADSSWQYPSRMAFEREHIYTPWQGLHEFLSNGDLFVESTDQGKVFILRGEEVIFRQYPNPITPDSLTEYPHWVRIYENLDFLK